MRLGIRLRYIARGDGLLVDGLLGLLFVLAIGFEAMLLLSVLGVVLQFDEYREVVGANIRRRSRRMKRKCALWKKWSSGQRRNQ